MHDLRTSFLCKVSETCYSVYIDLIVFIFALLFLALATLYVRYKQVQGYLEQLEESKYTIVKRMNEISLVLSVFICLGLSLVANFQVTVI